jgi:phosphatidate cytidylyltransferase
VASRREPRGAGSDLPGRIAIAVPAAIFAIVIVRQGGALFMLALMALGVLALGELYGLMARVRPPALAGFLTVIAMLVAAEYGEPRHVVMVLVASFPVTFLLGLLRPRRENISWAIAASMLGVLWIGLPLVHAIWLRDLHIASGDRDVVTGMGLVFDVLIATFIGDTVAYFVGRAYGRTPIAPLISPNKTLEGLAGGVVGGTLAFWCAGVYQDWLSGGDALLIGFLVALAAPVGDLFESMIKRDLAVKDTGRFFGAHGGVLDRLDAAFFTIVVGYYAAVALGYG